MPFRPLGFNDVPALAELDAICFPPTIAYNADYFETRVLAAVAAVTPSGPWFVAVIV